MTTVEINAGICGFTTVVYEVSAGIFQWSGGSPGLSGSADGPGHKGRQTVFLHYSRFYRIID